jgi:Mrp family chromosome partitioning ATPase
MGHRAAVVDCNLVRPHLHQALGEPNFVGLTSSLEGDKPLEESGIEAAPGLLVIPTGPVPANPVKYLETERFVAAVRDLEESRDLVLLDAPVADRVLSSQTFSERFDGVLLVIHASRTSKNTARAATDDLLEAGVNLLGVVLNGGS